MLGTLIVQIIARFNIVDCIDDKVNAVPELFVEDVLGVRTSKLLIILAVERTVHLSGAFTCRVRLEFANMLRVEKELTTKVAELNFVVVRDMDHTFRRAADSCHRKNLQELAPESSRADHESMDLAKLLLNLS